MSHPPLNWLILNYIGFYQYNDTIERILELFNQVLQSIHITTLLNIFFSRTHFFPPLKLSWPKMHRTFQDHEFIVDKKVLVSSFLLLLLQQLSKISNLFLSKNLFFSIFYSHLSKNYSHNDADSTHKLCPSQQRSTYQQTQICEKLLVLFLVPRIVNMP